jgi:site-specific DNA recombinase
MVYGKTYTKRITNEKTAVIKNGNKPKYVIKNHHEPIIDEETFNQVQEIINAETRKQTTHEKRPYTQFVYSLMHDKYLHWKNKVPNKPEYDLLENEYKRIKGTPRIYTKTAPHVTIKATIALARKFSDIETKFDKQVHKRLNNKAFRKKTK